MSLPADEIGEIDLHAYIDGQLDQNRQSAVAAYLIQNPDVAKNVHVWQSQRRALRQIFLEDASMPTRSEFLRLAESRLRRRRMASWATAATITVATTFLGGSIGWQLRGRWSDGGEAALSRLEEQAIATHAVYSVDRRHPVEVLASDRDHLAQWLSNRLNRKISPPDLTKAGWRLLGGRLLATERGGPAALFMYDNASGEKLSLMIRPLTSNTESSEVPITGQHLNGSAWIEGGLGYAVISAGSPDNISAVTRMVRQQIAA